MYNNNDKVSQFLIHPSTELYKRKRADISDQRLLDNPMKCNQNNYSKKDFSTTVYCLFAGWVVSEGCQGSPETSILELTHFLVPLHQQPSNPIKLHEHNNDNMVISAGLLECVASQYHMIGQKMCKECEHQTGLEKCGLVSPVGNLDNLG